MVLYAGDSIPGKRLIYERPILKSPFFRLDSRNFETKEVAFFKNNHGIFANLFHLYPGKERYAMKIASGRVSVYEQIDISIYGNDELDVELPEGQSTSPILASGGKLDYYRKGRAEILPAKHSFLKVDLQDNPNSLEHLKNYRTYRNLQWGTLGLGITTAVLGLFLNDNNRAEFSPIAALGIGVAGASYFYEYPKRDELWFAVEEYNK